MVRLIIAAVAALDIAWWIMADRQLRPLRRRRFWRTLLAIFMIFQLAWIAMWIAAPGVVRSTRMCIPASLTAALFLWHLLVLPASVVSATVISIALRIYGTARRMFTRSTPQKPATPSPAGPTRRQILAAAAVAVPPLVLAGAVGRGMSDLGNFRIRRLNLRIANLPPALAGLTIAHLSDTHIGRFTSEKMLANVAEQTNALGADLILFTGDLIDYTIADLPAAIDFMRRLQPRDALALCVGNHDLIDDPLGFVHGVRSAGLPLLENQSRIIPTRHGHPIQLLGIPWSRGESALARAVEDVLPRHDDGEFRILLAHHPHAFDHAARLDIPLTLAGHTHGGQLMLNERLGAGPVLFRYVSGPYHRDQSTLVVSNGVGNWFPLRINAPAEIVHITLQCG